MERRQGGLMDRLGDFFNQDNQRQQEYQQFSQRYSTDPHSISEAEAARRYREMMAHSYMDDDDDDDYGDEQVFSQMSPQDRRLLAQRYQEATRDPNRPYQGYPQGMDLDQAAQPRNLGRMTRRAAREDGDLLDQLVGPSSPLSSTAGKLALAGGAAFLASRFMGRR